MHHDEGFWSALCTFWRVRYFSFKDLCKTIFYFWRKPKFALVDLALLGSYFFQSPYRIARQFSGGDSPYGETPLVVLQKIAKDAGITPKDTVFELGCGRGRTAFWLSVFLGCQCVGIEYVPTFVQKAKKLASLFHVDNVTFLEKDICSADLSTATVIYLFGTCLSDEEIHTLIDHFATLASGVKIITISYPLHEYTHLPTITLEKSLEVTFPWGTTTAYLHKIKRA